MTDPKPAPKLAPGEFENEALGCSFSLPEPFRMRHVERYNVAGKLARDTGAVSAFAINWIGAVAIIEDWDCKALPDLSKLAPADISDTYGEVMQVIVWVANTVNAYVVKKLFIPKN